MYEQNGSPRFKQHVNNIIHSQLCTSKIFVITTYNTYISVSAVQ